jgi:carotenoid 1,2-hydratase
VAVAPNGYAWWYIDASSADGAYGLTIIAFIGSVFSPYYKLSGRKRPDNHCAINVSLTGPRGSAWAMTERSAAHVHRARDHFTVGPSGVRWDGNTMVIDIAEISAPLPYKVRGTVRVTPEMIGSTAFALDPDGRHRWHPVAPRAHVEVEMSHPGVRWSGPGYFDSNFGDEPLEHGFNDWHWSRAHLRNDVAVLYEGRRRDGTPFDLSLRHSTRARRAAAHGLAGKAGHARRCRFDAAGDQDMDRRAILCPIAAVNAAVRRRCPRGARKPVARPLSLTDRPVDASLSDAPRLLVTHRAPPWPPCPWRSPG